MVQKRGLRKFINKVNFGVEYDAWHGYRNQRISNRFKKHTYRHHMRYKPGSGKRLQRLRYIRKTRKGGHNLRRRKFKKRRRFMPYMERVYVQMPRGAYWENKRFFRVRNHRVNVFKGNTTIFSPKHKGPGYSQYDTSHHERWHVWDGGYYNPNESCWTRADVFNPINQPFEPRRQYSYSFLEDHTTLIPFDPHRDWSLPWRLTNPIINKRGLTRYPMFMRQVIHDQKLLPDYLQSGYLMKENNPRFEHLPNVEMLSLHDDDQYKDYEESRKWPVPQDDKWKL